MSKKRSPSQAPVAGQQDDLAKLKKLAAEHIDDLGKQLDRLGADAAHAARDYANAVSKWRADTQQLEKDILSRGLQHLQDQRARILARIAHLDPQEGDRLQRLQDQLADIDRQIATLGVPRP